MVEVVEEEDEDERGCDFDESTERTREKVREKKPQRKTGSNKTKKTNQRADHASSAGTLCRVGNQLAHFLEIQSNGLTKSLIPSIDRSDHDGRKARRPSYVEWIC
jgi:hypothetical protein